jgi:hypothetical protein
MRSTTAVLLFAAALCAQAADYARESQRVDGVPESAPARAAGLPGHPLPVSAPE